MRERGQSIVELALALPILLIVLLGLMDLGRAYYISVALEDMAAEGVSYATLHPSDLDEIQARAVAGSVGLVEVDASAVRIESSGSTSGDTVTVTVPLQFEFVTPFVSQLIGQSELELRGTASAVILGGE